MSHHHLTAYEFPPLIQRRSCTKPIKIESRKRCSQVVLSLSTLRDRKLRLRFLRIFLCTLVHCGQHTSRRSPRFSVALSDHRRYYVGRVNCSLPDRRQPPSQNLSLQLSLSVQCTKEKTGICTRKAQTIAPATSPLVKLGSVLAVLVLLLLKLCMKSRLCLSRYSKPRRK